MSTCPHWCVVMCVSAASLLLQAGCSTTPERPKRLEPQAHSTALRTLASWMTGSFTSAAQAQRQPDDYFDVRLEMARIWPQRTDGYWLYVEQALATNVDRPYRQRIYHVFEQSPGTFVSETYLLPDEAMRFAGTHHDPSRLSDLSPGQLELREGCAVYLTRADGAFIGSTIVGACPSTLHGASYATSDIVITVEALMSWDRGYNDDGVQVWGAQGGPYVFEKVADYALE